MGRQFLFCAAIVLGFVMATDAAEDQNDLPEETIHAPSLTAPVHVSFDALGIPRIDGTSFEDVAFAQGYAHAQDRFFQMDLFRRRAAGRLSALVGETTVDMDREIRVYGFEQLSVRILEGLPAHHVAWLEKYSAGVNAGLSALAAPPIEYALMGAEPREWSPSDSVLVMLMMAMDLSSGESSERVRSALVDVLPRGIADLLTPVDTRFDAPIDADAKDRTGGYRPLPIPGPDIFDVRNRRTTGEHIPTPAMFDEQRPALGSNNWAVAGSRTVHGGAILANDMHLTHSLPNVWYRVQLEWEHRSDEEVRHIRIAGVSLPGVPGIIVGSSGRLAWGFTNLTGDLVDLVRLEIDPDDPNRYRVPDGWERFESRTERIDIRGGEAVEMEIRSTRWGPVIRPAHDGSLVAMRWAGLDAAHANLALLDMPWAQTLEEGVEIMSSWMGPPQNALLADWEGDIAWVPTGFIPVRKGFDGRESVSWADPQIGWVGTFPRDQRPRVIRPESGLLFTANNRTLSISPASPTFGDDFANGTRAARIRELLEADRPWNELDVFRVALDTKVPLMEHYREHLLRAADERGESFEDAAAQALKHVRSWDGTASADQAGYRLLRRYRDRLQRAVLGPLLAPVVEEYPGFRYTWFASDEPVLRLLEDRPLHLLHWEYADWNDLLLTQFVAMVDSLIESNQPGINASWGDVNRSAIEHPLSAVLPERLRSMLAAEPAPLDGDVWAIRVARPRFGASQRMAVSPGREEFGLMHMPGGQSGKPMSPNFLDQHRAWLSGDPLPLLSGPPARRLTLTPKPD